MPTDTVTIPAYRASLVVDALVNDADRLRRASRARRNGGPAYADMRRYLRQRADLAEATAQHIRVQARV